MYPNVKLHIAGTWRGASSGETLPVINPATAEQIGTHPVATAADLDSAAEAAQRGFRIWKSVSTFERYKILRNAAALVRERTQTIAQLMTIEQGKPLAEAIAEVAGGADTMDWFAEEGRRAYGRIIPPRAEGITQMVIREPVGPVAAFIPWNFPVNQAVRKLSAALTVGCSAVLKGAEEAPACCVEVIKAFLDAGVPTDALSLVFGRPAEISKHLISHPSIRKLTFTGSTTIGKQLAALAGQHMKRTTMELGGHAPAIVFKDADIKRATNQLAAAKYRNAGQVCIAPSRFLVHENLYEEFVAGFVEIAKNLQVGDGMVKGTTMGPLAHSRRIEIMEGLVSDALSRGGQLRLGGRRIGNRGYFFEPTVITNVPVESRLMNEEPFGPIAAINSFRDEEEALLEANRLPYGLAAYAYTCSLDTQAKLAARLESGMLAINHLGLSLPEVPFGGIKDSGYGSEGGTEALEGYLNTKFVTQGGA